MKNRYLLLALMGSLGWADPLSAQIGMAAFVVGSGASETSNTELQMVGTFGQPLVGIVGNNAETHIAGFWGPIAAGTSTGVERLYGPEVPQQYRLDTNYPNPFNPATTIPFQLPERVSVKLTVYDMLGKTVAVLVDQVLAPGHYRQAWDTRDRAGRPVSSGIYVYRLETPGYSQVRMMTLLK